MQISEPKFEKGEAVIWLKPGQQKVRCTIVTRFFNPDSGNWCYENDLAGHKFYFGENRYEKL